MIGGWASDGCAVIGERGGAIEVISATGILSIGHVRSATLGIDISASVAPNAIAVYLDSDLADVADDSPLGSAGPPVRSSGRC